MALEELLEHTSSADDVKFSPPTAKSSDERVHSECWLELKLCFSMVLGTPSKELGLISGCLFLSPEGLGSVLFGVSFCTSCIFFDNTLLIMQDAICVFGQPPSKDTDFCKVFFLSFCGESGTSLETSSCTKTGVLCWRTSASFERLYVEGEFKIFS